MLKRFRGFIQAPRRGAGFTLIELLVVIGILGILLAIVLIAINPAAQFAQANNTKRQSDVSSILNAIHQYAADNKGTLPAGIPTGTATEISDAGADICAVISPDYIALLPVDPVGTADTTDCSANYATGYTVVKDANGRVTVAAPSAEAVRGVAVTISVTR